VIHGRAASCLIPAAVSTNSSRVRRKSLLSRLLNARSNRIVSADDAPKVPWARASESFTSLKVEAVLILFTRPPFFPRACSGEWFRSERNLTSFCCTPKHSTGP
jgi:hypothetical protein